MEEFRPSSSSFLATRTNAPLASRAMIPPVDEGLRRLGGARDVVRMRVRAPPLVCTCCRRSNASEHMLLQQLASAESASRWIVGQAACCCWCSRAARLASSVLALIDRTASHAARARRATTDRMGYWRADGLPDLFERAARAAQSDPLASQVGERAACVACSACIVQTACRGRVAVAAHLHCLRSCD